jgi:hypothetical protein
MIVWILAGVAGVSARSSMVVSLMPYITLLTDRSRPDLPWPLVNISKIVGTTLSWGGFDYGSQCGGSFGGFNMENVSRRNI